MSLHLTKAARNSLLAIGAILALFVSLKSDANRSIPSAQVKPSKRRLSAKRAPASQAAPRKDLLVGDRSLLGQIHLGKARLVRDHYETRLRDGSKAVLTLDPTWQQAAEKVLAQAKAPRAAIVVMQPDGKILALAGARYENNSMTKDASMALDVWAPAASTFKIVTAASLLANGLPAKKKVCYHGGLRSVERDNLVDNARVDTACNPLEYGLAKSQNALVAKLVSKFLKRDQLQATAKDFGFSKAPSFALASQAPRLDLPTEPLAFARVAAGFWKSEASALSAALMVNTIASGGFSVSPRIVAEVRESKRTIPVVAKAPKRVYKERLAKSLAKMMSATVRYGTAKKAFLDRRGRPYLGSTSVAGKTGSLSRSAPSYLGYSWFVGFAPVDDPQVVIAVLLGNPAKWYLKAHTAARLVLQSHF